MNGAKCDKCPLQGCSDPVPPEIGHNAAFAVVGESPKDQEVREGRPFVGPDGQTILGALARVGVQRGDCHLTLTVLCQPPKNDLDRVVLQIQRANIEITKRNAARAKANEPSEPEPLLLTPQEACRPRLAAELARYENMLLLGTVAAKAVLGTSQSIMAIRGGLVDGRLRYDPHANTLRVIIPETTVDEHGAAVPVLGPAALAALGTPARVVPTLSPGFVQHAQRYTKPFRCDVSRAVRWFRGTLRWRPPEMVFNPAPAVLRAFLTRPGTAYTYDVETDGIEPTVAKLRCIAIGTSDFVMCIGLLSIDGFTRFYSPGDETEILDIIRAWLADPALLKIGHNAGSYDRIVCLAQLGVDPQPTLDTILLHRLVESELPHNLGFVGSVYTDVHSWKADAEGNKLAWGSQSDEQLHSYCCFDVAVTAQVVPPLFDAVRVRGQAHLVEIDHKVQRICGDMHRVGMYVDQEERARAERETLHEVVTLRGTLRGLSGIPDLNPGSTRSLQRLLFNVGAGWGLVPPVDDELRYTKSGDPSTNDDVIRGLLSLKKLAADPATSDQRRTFLKRLRDYRSKQKELGTYIVKLRPRDQLTGGMGWDEDEPEEERQEREARGYETRGITWPDGRMRPGYNAHVAVTGRLSSSRPINAQNFPKVLRRLIRAAPGHILVGADADQVELRIAAARWGSKLYLDAFAADADPHSMTALAVFGDRFANADGWPEGDKIQLGKYLVPRNGSKFKGTADKLRKLSKSIQYASQYKGSVETVQRLLQQSEDENGELNYLALTLREVRTMHEAWVKGAQFDVGWDSEIAAFRANGYIVEPVHGRRRDCLDGENPNEIVNFPIQGAAAGIINTAMIQIANEIPLHRWGPGTGLLTQTHDSMVIEVPDDGVELVERGGKKVLVARPGCPADIAREVIEAAMNVTHPALPSVRFTAGADFGLTWDKVG